MQTFFFDLDNTLYPHSAGVTEALEEKMNAYVAQITQLSIPAATTLRQGYFQQYGTTLRGLQLHYNVDSELYLAAVHDIPIEELVIPNGALCTLLHSWLGQSAVFTNSPREHAVRVLARLGFAEHALRITDIRALDFIPKPHLHAYQRALDSMDSTAKNAVLFEDTLANLKTAKEIGMRTVYMQANDKEIQVPNYVDAVYNDIVSAITVECKKK